MSGYFAHCSHSENNYFILFSPPHSSTLTNSRGCRRSLVKLCCNNVIFQPSEELDLGDRGCVRLRITSKGSTGGQVAIIYRCVSSHLSIGKLKVYFCRLYSKLPHELRLSK